MIDTRKITGGDPQAVYFVQCWGDYLRACDNTVDENLWSEQNLIGVFALGCTCFTSNFYRQQVNRLQMVILVGTNLWQVANEWERSSEKWKVWHAEVLRNMDVLLLNALCQICSGWTTAAEASRALYASGYAYHVKKYGDKLC